MSVIWKKVWFDLWQHKLRTLLVVLSIAVGVFAVGITFGLIEQLIPTMDSSHRSTSPSHATMFLTPPEFKQQVGYIVYPAGNEIARHTHRPLKRHLVGTSEVLVVLKGKAEIDVYDDVRKLVATRELHQGDMMLMISGGHGFRMLEDTVFLEIKQGPYTGLNEKEQF